LRRVWPKALNFSGLISHVSVTSTFVVAVATHFFEAAVLALKVQLNAEFFSFDLLAAEV
jgi:hypothetical protein